MPVTPAGGYTPPVLLRWARASNLTTGRLAAVRNGPAQRPATSTAGTPRRLLHDAAIRPEDRLAGQLVMLYAQGATAISQMTVAQIQASDDSVRLRLGRVPIHLPRAGRHDRPHRAGQPRGPGRHRSPAALSLTVPRRPARPTWRSSEFPCS